MENGDLFLSLFVSEASDLLSGMEKGLKKLEAEDPSALPELFRQAHSIKGMAASIGLCGIEALANVMEDAFDTLRRESATPVKELSELLLRSTDALANAVEEVAEGREEPSQDGAVRQLRELVEKPESFLREESVEPVDVLELEIDEPWVETGAESDQAKTRVGRALLDVSVQLEKDVQLPAARAAVIRKHAIELGEIRQASTELEEGALHFLLEANRSAQEVATTIRELDGVDSVEVRLAPASAASELSGEAFVRVPVGAMDLLLEETAEILVQHAQLERLAPLTEEPEMRFTLARLKTATSRILNSLLEARLLPFHSIRVGLERTVRELERRLAKKAILVVEGAEVRLDRAVLEGLVDPLTHLLRNAMDHGIESAPERKLAGKEEEGRLAIRLARTSDMVEIVVEDDGRGMDPDKLRARAIACNAIDEDAAMCLDTEETLLLATLPGITTAEEATQVSGRGVGLDAVRDKIEAVGGSLLLESEVGRGTTVALRLPPTVAIIQVFIVRAGLQLYAVPVPKVEETLCVHPGLLHRINGRAVLPWKGDVAEAFPLAAALEGRECVPAEEGVAMLYNQRGEPRAAIVQEVLGCQEVVVKPLHGPLEAMGEMAGAAVIDDGSVAPVLDLENIGPPKEARACRG